jgi:hypothetical protein
MSGSFVKETDMTITAPAVTEPKTATRNGGYAAAAADQTTIAAGGPACSRLPRPAGTGCRRRPAGRVGPATARR